MPCKDSEMAKNHCEIMCDGNYRFHLMSKHETRLRYTALLVGRAEKKNEVVSWFREINQNFILNPGDEIIIGRTTFQVRIILLA